MQVCRVTKRCKISLKFFLLLILVQCNISTTINRDAAEEKSAEGDEAKAEGEPPKKIWSQASFANEYRKFNIDMTPKVRKLKSCNLHLSQMLISSSLTQLFLVPLFILYLYLCFCCWIFYRCSFFKLRL